MHSLSDEDWLAQYRAPTPPENLPTDEDLEKDRAEERRGQTKALRDRLPEFVRSRSASDLLEAIKADSMRDAARTWEPWQGNLLLLGETDTGKSTAAAYICRRLIAAGATEGGDLWRLAQGLYWVHAAKLEKALQAQPFGRGPCRELQLAGEAQLLVLDDAGWERDPRSTAPLLAERYDAGRITIMTSGLTIGELRGPDEGQASSVTFPGYGSAVMRRFATSNGKRGRIVRAFPKRDAAQAALDAQARAKGNPTTHFSEVESRGGS